MANINTNNTELNKAIWTVLSTKFKKEAKEAFKMVEAAGYEVYKNGCGTWTVRNNHTGKSIMLEYLSSYRTPGRLYFGDYGRHSRSIRSDEWTVVATKFDFVNCLKTPRNRAYEEACDAQNFRSSKAVAKYGEIKNKKWNIDYDERCIADIQKKIQDLQRDMMRYTEYKVNSQRALAQLRREYGLVK